MTLPAGMVALSTKQMVEVDRAMMDDLHIELLQMMENAGRALADLARARYLAGDPRGRRVVVLAGTGGNGGGALVAARRLHGWGADVRVIVSADDAAFAPVPAHQLGIIRRMEIPVVAPHAIESFTPELVLDGVIGYALRDAPRGEAATLIRWANAQAAPSLALDVPSGMDATTGEIRDPAIRADATLTLALPKTGLLQPAAAPYVGALYVADIGVPPSLYARPGLDLLIGPIFAHADIVRIA